MNDVSQTLSAEHRFVLSRAALRVAMGVENLDTEAGPRAVLRQSNLGHPR